MARFTQGQFEHDQAARGLDEQTLRDALAALDGVEGKGAEQQRRFLQRRLDGVEVRAQRRAEEDAKSAQEIVDGIPR